ncbi:hypothetical protein D3C81_2102870 [compost metagenome]
MKRDRAAAVDPEQPGRAAVVAFGLIDAQPQAEHRIRKTVHHRAGAHMQHPRAHQFDQAGVVQWAIHVASPHGGLTPKSAATRMADASPSS